MELENKKYIFTDETKEWNGRILHRIQAVRDVGYVRTGDKGGWIEKEGNLSHKGNCWVHDEAKVYDNAEVFNNAQVGENAEVYNHACVFDDACVWDDSKVFENAKIFGEANISGHSKIYGNTKVRFYAQVCEYAEVFGDTKILGCAEICGDAVIKHNSDYFVFQNTWSSRRWFTYTKSNKMWKVGCFYGTGEELIEKAYEDGEISGEMYEHYVRFVESLEDCEF